MPERSRLRRIPCLAALLLARCRRQQKSAANQVEGGHRLEPQIAPHLSARQVEVLALIARGRTDREIAFGLGISPRTVRMHVDALKLKLRVQRRRDLFVTYHDLGGVDLLGGQDR